jgi:long-chain acyl-CoA synthetase
MAGTGAALSYAELDRQSNKIAQLFRSRGLRPGDHVAVLMDNRPEFFPVVWAAQRSGLFYTPVNWHLSRAEAAYIVADCGARLLVASSGLEELAAAAAASAPALRGRLTVGPPVGSGTPELADELIGFCRARIAHYKAPRSLSFEDELPRLPSGKMLRRLLMDRYRSLPPS